MTQTTSSSVQPAPIPAIVLVRPQMGENIGAAARAMWNFGLDHMRVVAPRDGWPSQSAVAMASGAGRLLDDGFDVCPFCLDDFAEGQQVTFFPCKGAHVAHSECTDRWLNIGSSCPTCRFALPYKSLELAVRWGAALLKHADR